MYINLSDLELPDVLFVVSLKLMPKSKHTY